MHVFTEENKVKSNFFKFVKVGDAIQGTFVGKSQQPNQLSETKELQWIYELLDENGEYWKVGGKLGIDLQMRHVNLGQIIEFKFIEERPNHKPGKSATKIIQVYADKNLVDEKWLQEQERQGVISDNGSTEGEKQLDVNEVAKEFGGTVVDEPFPTDKNATIEALAMQKFGITDKSQVVKIVQEKTGLAYIATNLDAILAKIKEL